MHPIVVFTKCCWSISLHIADREKPLPHKICRFTPSLCSLHALLVQHLYCEFFQHMVWNGPTSETVWIQRRQKNWLKYTDFTELKKITSRVYSNCTNYSSLFSILSNFRCCSFCFNKKCTVNFTSVLLILLLIHSTFFKGMEKSGFFGGFCWFLLSGHFQKHPGGVLVRSTYINPEDNYGPLIDFLSQISKLSYISVLELADFLMYH